MAVKQINYALQLLIIKIAVILNIYKKENYYYIKKNKYVLVRLLTYLIVRRETKIIYKIIK